MTRQEVLRIVIRRARGNGFEFRRWFLTAIHPSWTGFDGAVELLSQRRRYYALLFSHEFARAFWKQGCLLYTSLTMQNRFVLGIDEGMVRECSLVFQKREASREWIRLIELQPTRLGRIFQPADCV